MGQRQARPRRDAFRRLRLGAGAGAGRRARRRSGSTRSRSWPTAPTWSSSPSSRRRWPRPRRRSPGESTASSRFSARRPSRRLREAFGDTPVLRTMPNLAVEVNRGVICHTPLPTTAMARRLLELLGAARDHGRRSTRSTIDAATAVMGCAPAYLARAVRGADRGRREAGLDPELSDMLVREAAAGTGEHLLTPRAARDAGRDRLARRQHRGRARGARGRGRARRASRPPSRPRSSAWRGCADARRSPRSTAATSPRSSTTSSSSTSS